MPIIARRARGKARTSLQYQFYMADSPGFSDRILKFEDTSLGSTPEYTESPMIERKRRPSIAGRKVRRSDILQGMKVERVAYEVNMPEGHEAFREIVNAARKDCPYAVIFHDPCEASFILMNRSRFDAVKRRKQPIDPATEDGAPLTHFSKIHGIEQNYPLLKPFVVQSAAGFNILALAFGYGLCPDCDDGDSQVGAYAGGVPSATNVPHFRYTTNQFSGGAANAFAETDNLITDIYVHGNMWIAVTADDLDPATATEGHVKYSLDNGATWTTVHTATEGLYGVTFGESYFWIVGGGGLILKGESIGSLAAVTNSGMATTHFLSVDYEINSNAIFAVGHDGTDGKAARIVGDTISDISSSVGTLTAVKLYKVATLSEIEDEFGHVMIGGDNGFLVENVNAGNGETWTAIANPMGTNDVKVIVGNSWRTGIGAGSKFYRREISTGMDVVEAAEYTALGSLGTLTAGATAMTEYGVEYWVLGTTNSSNGALIVYRPDDLPLV